MSKTMMIMMLICFAGMLSGVTRIVDIDGTEQYTTIQSAINASASGDVVLVYPGRYFENVVIQANGITLQSLEATTNNPAYIDSTIIDGNAVNTCVKVYANVQNIQVRGFSITNAVKNGNGGGIVVTTNATAMITNCKVHNNIASGGGGVLVAGAMVTLSGVQIYNNRCLGGGGGINILGAGTQVTFDPVNRCSIYNNIAGGGQDIFVDDARSNIDVYLDTFTVSNSSSYYAQYYNYPGYAYHLNFDILNAYTQEINHDQYVSPEGNDANDGLTAQTALKTIHTAIYRTASDSLNPKTVHILPGTYSISANQQVFPITTKKWVNIVGSGMDITTIIGEHHPLFPSVNVTMISSYYQKNYTLSDMHLDYANQTEGSMIFGKDESNWVIRNIKISNLILGSPNLLYFQQLRDCIIDGLNIDNVTLSSGSIVKIDTGFKGIIKNWKITNCTSLAYIETVWVDPLVWLKVSDTTIENCIFDNLLMSDNDSHCIDVGGMENPPQPINLNIMNSRFSNITGEDGIVHFSSSNYPRINITNSTFSGCTGQDYTLQVNGVVNIQNSIFQNNTPHEIYTTPPEGGEHTHVTLNYNNIRNGQAGILNSSTLNQVQYLDTNNSEDPRFASINPLDDNYLYLTANSPCRNSGTPDTTGLSLPVMDLAGNYRIWNNRIDMGCYEFDSIPVGIEEEIQYPDTSTSSATVGALYNYPNPFNPTTTISYQLQKVGKVNLTIFNIKGQVVKSLVNENKSLGKHSVVWNGKDDSGNACASGVYLYKLKTGDASITRKMMLLK